MADRRPGIPSIDGSVPRAIAAVLRPMREILQMFTDPVNPVVRVQALVDAGLLTVNHAGALAPTAGEIDGTPPATLSGLAANGAVLSVILTWNELPSYLKDKVAYAEVWASSTDDIGTAVQIGMAPGQIYVDHVGANSQRYYWARYVSLANVPGNFNASGGTLGHTGVDAGALIDLLATEPPVGADFSALLYTQPTDITISGITVPAGVYMNAAYIRKLSVTDAMIANLTADKITAGDIAAERMAANIVTALEGKFDSLAAIVAYLGDVTINAGGALHTEGANAYGSGTGIWMGDDSGTYKLRIGSMSGHRLQWDGSHLLVQTPKFVLDADGNATFGGDLDAANGTFSGDLDAAGGTFSGELVAASGSFGGQLLAGVLDFAQLSGISYNYATPGTYTITVPAEKTSMRVTLIGAGGAGGGNTNMYDTGGGGGGAGGVTTATFTGLTPGATYTLYVGSGGVPTNSGSGVASGAGGHTYISGLTSANNGGQGGQNSVRSSPALGGAGGSGTAVDGGTGGASAQNGGWDVGDPPLNPGGTGGSSPFGAGGAGGSGFDVAGSNGAGYGGGGGGAGQTLGSYLPGGYGAGGRGIIEFFNPNSVVVRSEWNALVAAINAHGIAYP